MARNHYRIFVPALVCVGRIRQLNIQDGRLILMANTPSAKARPSERSTFSYQQSNVRSRMSVPFCVKVEEPLRIGDKEAATSPPLARCSPELMPV